MDRPAELVPSSAPPALVLESVSLCFGPTFAVKGVSLSLPAGATLALVGESGSGKSTLARLAAGLLVPDSGRVARAAGRVGMVFQDPVGALDPRWTVAASLAEPLHALSLCERAAVPARVAALLRAVGLPETAGNRRPGSFSIGQVQRITIARALAGEPDLLVCDEPTSALDVSVQAHMLNLLRAEQARRGMSLLLVSHDLGVVRFMADQVAVLLGGRVVESAAADTLFATPRHPYTRLLRGVSTEGDDSADDRPPPDGCPFQPRCSFATDICARVVPPLLAAGGSLVACHAVAAGRI